MSIRGEVLIAIINNPLDFALARDKHWYRIPISSVSKWLKSRWPPQWLAFYQTKVFGQEAYAVRYYAQVLDTRQAYRWQLFPDQPHDEGSSRRYYQIMLRPLQRLPKPIISRRCEGSSLFPRLGRSLSAQSKSMTFMIIVPWKTVCGQSSSVCRSKLNGKSG